MVSSAWRMPSCAVTRRTRTVGSMLRYPCSSSSPSGRSFGRSSLRTRNFLSISTPMVTSSDRPQSGSSESQPRVQPGSGVFDFLGDDHVAHRVLVPLDVDAEAEERIADAAAELDGKQRILQPVRGEH